MKTPKIITVAACTLLVLTVFNQPAKSGQQIKHEVVILRGVEMQWQVSVGEPGACGNGQGYDGIDVQNASCSSNAPQYRLPARWWPCPPPDAPRPRINMAQAMADLLDQGYTIRHIDQYQLTVIMVK